MVKYAIIVGRFQPFHIGHQSLVDKAIQDGLEPLIIIGSANESGTEKNPFTAKQRDNMIRLIYPDIKTAALNDHPSYDRWLHMLIKFIVTITDQPLENSTIYLHEKEEDKHDYVFEGIKHYNESYCKMYKLIGLNTKSLPISDIDISATDIRKDLEGNKHFLHPKIYEYVKGRL